MLRAGTCQAAAGALTFQRAPTLGGECYCLCQLAARPCLQKSFNGHPPLGVNATRARMAAQRAEKLEFQWAPILGGECYGIVYLITPPFVKGSTRSLTIPSNCELNALREPRRKLNSKANSGEVRAKYVCRRQVWCGAFLGVVLSSKLGGVLGGCGVCCGVRFNYLAWLTIARRSVDI